MRRTIVGLSALFLLAAAALPARACINDSEVKRAEREFKSQYLQQPSPGMQPVPESPRPQGNGWSVVFLGGGTVLLLGAAVTVLNLPRRSARE
jgi:hypothetical protein